MSLLFDRKQFKSGIQKVYEPFEVQVQKERLKVDSDGKPVLDAEGKQLVEKYMEKETKRATYVFEVRDKGKLFDFHDEEYILSKYGALFQRV